MITLLAISALAGASLSSFRHVLAFGAGTLFFAVFGTVSFAVAGQWSTAEIILALLGAITSFQAAYLLTAYARSQARSRTPEAPSPDIIPGN